MRFDFLDRRSAERFAELLDEPGTGRRPQHTRGPAAEELAELVAIGHRLSAPRTGVQVDPEFRVGLRAMLVATAERDGIGAAAAENESEHVGGHAAVREPRLGLLGRGSGRRLRARGAIVIGVAAGAMAVSGISAASENATPGDALYGVKRSTERAQLAMAGSDVTRGQLSLDFARNRLAEAAALGQSMRGKTSQGSTTEFDGVLDDMDADTRQGVKLLHESAVARKDAAPLTRVDAFVAAQRQTFAPMLAVLGPANKARAEDSLGLLDRVEERAAGLRTGLACDSVERQGADALGPELRDCSTAGTSTDSGEEPAGGNGHGQKQGTKEREPSDTETVSPERTADPDGAGTGSTKAPSGSGKGDTTGPGTGDRSPAPDPGTSAPADPGSEEDEGLLDGLLGGIFD